MISPLLMVVAAASGIGIAKIYVDVLPAIREKKMRKIMDELSNPDGSIAWGLFKSVHADWVSGERFKTADEYRSAE